LLALLPSNVNREFPTSKAESCTLPIIIKSKYLKQILLNVVFGELGLWVDWGSGPAAAAFTANIAARRLLHQQASLC
jgi:hypothetical protein